MASWIKRSRRFYGTEFGLFGLLVLILLRDLYPFLLSYVQCRPLLSPSLSDWVEAIKRNCNAESRFQHWNENWGRCRCRRGRHESTLFLFPAHLLLHVTKSPQYIHIMNRILENSNNFNRICCKTSIFSFWPFDQFLALGRVSCGGTGGVPVLRCHVGFYIWPGVADEGAGGALKGLSVSGHVLGEIVLKILSPWVCNSVIQEWINHHPHYLANKSSLAHRTRVIFGTVSGFVLAKSWVFREPLGTERTGVRRFLQRIGRGLCFQDCTGWPSRSQTWVELT